MYVCMHVFMCVHMHCATFEYSCLVCIINERFASGVEKSVVIYVILYYVIHLYIYT